MNFIPQNQTVEEKNRQMLSEPVDKLVLSLAGPAIITNLISSIYNAADTFFIGKISTSASAAVGVSFVVMTIIQALGFFFGQGTGNSTAKLLGAGDTDGAGRLIATGFFTCMSMAILVCWGSRVFLEPLCYASGSTQTILPYAKAYAGVILLGGPFMSGSFFLNNQLRYQGLTFYGMIGIGLGGVLNMALDPLLIFVFDMGIAGAAWATIISQFISFVLLLYLFQTRAPKHVSFASFRPCADHYKMIVNGGLPSLSRQSVAGFSTAALNLAAGTFGGDAAVAAMTIATRITRLTNQMTLGFGQAFQPVCGFNYGARRYGRVNRAYRFCCSFSMKILFVLCIIEFAVAPQLIAFFRNDADVIAIGAQALRYSVVFFWISGFVMVSSMLLQTTGKVVRATVLGLIREGVFLYINLKIFPEFLGMGLTGVEISPAVSDLCSAAAAFLMVMPLVRELKRLDAADSGEKEQKNE